MKQIEPDIKDSAKNALLSSLAEIGFMEIEEFEGPCRHQDIQADLVAKVKFPGGSTRVVSEVRKSGQPRIAREAVNQMIRYKKSMPDAYFVFIAPYISERAAEICRSENIGYLDLSGNCLLAFDTVYIKKEGAPNKYSEKRDLKSLYSPKAERILRVLLCSPGKKWKIKDLADESEVSLGQASNVKRFLCDREFISGERGGLKLKAPEALVKEWAENYDGSRNRIQEMYSMQSAAQVEKAVAEFCGDNNIDYALTGFSGAARTALAVRYQKAMVYVSGISAEAFSELSLKPVPSGGNLLLFSPYDKGVFYGTSIFDGIRVVSEIQLYLDLQGFRGRGEEASQAIFERILAKSW